ncbi:MAG: cation:proton antiporter [Alphaproteobacteria bacterium]|nr:cation:proton antiporter [Alphaproteobacteria bacterium]
MLSNHELLPLAIVVLVALSCGLLLTRLRQPAVVGYIVAGLVLGPSGFELVENEESIGLLAELGVLLLLFVIGMELSLRAFRRIWKIAVTTVLLQTGGALLMVWLIGHQLGWPVTAVMLLAFVLALSSTAVAVKMLEDIGELRTRTGRITVGILIAQDLAVVPMILLVDLAAIGSFDVMAVGRIVLSVGLLLALILFLSRRQRLTIPFLGEAQKHSDLTPLLGLVCCFGAATISALLGLSPAYGAFLAGLTIGNSNLRVGMLDMVMPIQSVLMMVFFLSVGLLIDLSLIWNNLGIILLMLLIVTVGKTAINLAIFAALRLPWAQGLLAALILAQVGEFSFLLGNVGLQREIISIDEFRIILSVTALSLVISPLYMNAIRRLSRAASFQRASIKYVLRIAFGREADTVSRAVRRVAAIRPGLPRRLRNASRAPADDNAAD